MSIIAIFIIWAILIYEPAHKEAQVNPDSSNLMELVGEASPYINEYRDSETGVQYYVFSKNVDGGMGGICPRYNADGTLYSD